MQRGGDREGGRTSRFIGHRGGFRWKKGAEELAILAAYFRKGGASEALLEESAPRARAVNTFVGKKKSLRYQNAAPGRRLGKGTLLRCNSSKGGRVVRVLSQIEEKEKDSGGGGGMFRLTVCAVGKRSFSLRRGGRSWRFSAGGAHGALREGKIPHGKDVALL